MIRVLFLAANPAGTTQLALDDEVRGIVAETRVARHRYRPELIPHSAVHLDDVSGIVRFLRPHVVHFSDIGAPAGEIVPLDADGSPRPIAPETLLRLFRGVNHDVRVVVLNTCYSEPQAEAIVREIDCAVTMRRAIGDKAAVAFASEFYLALANGWSVQDAFDRGVVRLTGEAVAEARGLVGLHNRQGVNPSQVVLAGDDLRDGELEQHLGGRHWMPKRAAFLIWQLARELAAAHRQGIVHLYLNPANILLAPDGTPKIVNFGLHKLPEVVEAEQHVCRSPVTVGEPGYLAPEQARGETKNVGPAADIYALGAILYELLTGRTPFQADTPLNTLKQIISDAPVPPRQLNPSVPRDLEAICLKCLQKDPSRRYTSAEGLAADLRRCLDIPRFNPRFPAPSCPAPSGGAR